METVELISSNCLKLIFSQDYEFLDIFGKTLTVDQVIKRLNGINDCLIQLKERVSFMNHSI
jgi:hypothetical protein